MKTIAVISILFQFQGVETGKAYSDPIEVTRYGRDASYICSPTDSTKRSLNKSGYLEKYMVAQYAKALSRHTKGEPFKTQYLSHECSNIKFGG